jgi:hypothetical protein
MVGELGGWEKGQLTLGIWNYSYLYLLLFGILFFFFCIWNWDYKGLGLLTMDACEYCFYHSVYGILAANVWSHDEGRITNGFIMYHWNILCGTENPELWEMVMYKSGGNCM